MAQGLASPSTIRRPLAALAGGSVLAILLYLALFGLVVSKPLTLGEIGAFLPAKLAIARAQASPKVLLVAGSNARFSHSCLVLQEILARPCANMGINASIGPDYYLDQVLGVVGPGDLIYVPLEYMTFSLPEPLLYGDEAGPYLYRHDRAALWALGPKRFLHAAFSFDLRFLIQGTVETALAARGRARRLGVATMGPLGDETGNTMEAARPYAPYLAGLLWLVPQPQPPGLGADLVARFIAQAKARGAIVVGGLPTTFDDQPVPDALVEQYRDFFTRHGAGFIALPNRSQYPRSDFFDTPDHLNAEAQRRHSERVGAALAGFLAQCSEVGRDVGGETGACAP